MPQHVQRRPRPAGHPMSSPWSAAFAWSSGSLAVRGVSAARRGRGDGAAFPTRLTVLTIPDGCSSPTSSGAGCALTRVYSRPDGPDDLLPQNSKSRPTNPLKSAYLHYKYIHYKYLQSYRLPISSPPLPH